MDSSGGDGVFGDTFGGRYPDQVVGSNRGRYPARTQTPSTDSRSSTYGCRVRYLREGPRLRQVGVTLPSPDQPSVEPEHPVGARGDAPRWQQAAHQRMYIVSEGRQGLARLIPAPSGQAPVDRLGAHRLQQFIDAAERP